MLLTISKIRSAITWLMPIIHILTKVHTMIRSASCRIAGGRTYLNLMCLDGDFHFIPFKDENGIFKGITIACCGDDALDAIMKALIFTGDVLTDQCCEVND